MDSEQENVLNVLMNVELAFLITVFVILVLLVTDRLKATFSDVKNVQITAKTAAFCQQIASHAWNSMDSNTKMTLIRINAKDVLKIACIVHRTQVNATTA